jgi:hypothetical protein
VRLVSSVCLLVIITQFIWRLYLDFPRNRRIASDRQRHELQANLPVRINWNVGGNIQHCTWAKDWTLKCELQPSWWARPEAHKSGYQNGPTQYTICWTLPPINSTSVGLSRSRLKCSALEPHNTTLLEQILFYRIVPLHPWLIKRQELKYMLFLFFVMFLSVVRSAIEGGNLCTMQTVNASGSFYFVLQVFFNVVFCNWRGNLSTMQTVNASLNFKGADISLVSPLAEREILSTQFACLKLLLNQWLDVNLQCGTH